MFQDLINGKFTLCVTTDILLEYEEIITRKLGRKVAESVMKVLDNLYNVEYIIKYFFWELIKADYDDNKFVDCSIACNANYLATNDNHFNVLKDLDFPTINIVNLDELTLILKDI
ncbi:MAG: PIN domain-containing protein [Bacteroidales bacterium]|nr:PIN domain-containing protein [Bacteroidales bacterium]